ncbi:MAG: NUDIX hydrolase [Alphaproteobacteria bacterium]|nr:NUDIX hydrolase [Alphaproteobacteria bacterium]
MAGTRLIHADRWIRLRADHCITPEGAVLDPYYVLEYRDWVHVVAITEDDCLVVNHQYRHGAGCVHLELPGGVTDAADAGPLEAAARELREETGFAAREFRHITSLSPNSATHTNRIHIVLALGAYADGAQSLDAGEEIAVELLPLSEIPALVSSGAFLQAAHVASLMVALQAIGRVQFHVAPKATP